MNYVFFVLLEKINEMKWKWNETSETIQSLGQFVTESSVTSGHEYITFVVSTVIRNPDQTIQEFVQDQQDQEITSKLKELHPQLKIIENQGSYMYSILEFEYDKYNVKPIGTVI